MISGVRDSDIIASFDPVVNHRIFKSSISAEGAGRSGK
jgi:hypothetical protein